METQHAGTGIPGQLRIGEQATPKAEQTFASDEMLASLLLDVEAVLRGVTAKIAAVRRHLQGSHPDPDPDPGRMRRALEYMADPESWLGSPHDSRSILVGADTPFELATAVLAGES